MGFNSGFKELKHSFRWSAATFSPLKHNNDRTVSCNKYHM